MKKKWYNKPISLRTGIIFFTIWFFIILLGPLLDSRSLVCSKTKDTCSIYSNNIFSNTTKLIRQFHISDIDDTYITTSTYHSYLKMDTTIYLKSGEYFDLGFTIFGKKRAKEIIYNIKNKDNYTLRGNYWKELFGYY